MCGLPGGYPDDLIDVDLDALEGPEADGVIRVTNADYLARPLRLTPTEATAMIVALRALRGGAGDDDPRDRRPRAGQARGGRRRRLRRRPDRPRRRPGRPDLVRLEADLRRRGGRAAPGAAELLRALARRAVRAGRRPARRRHRPRLHLPRRLVPQRRGAAAVPARPDRRAPRCSTAPVETDARGAARPRPTGFFAALADDHPGRPCGSTPRPAGSSSTTRSRPSAAAAAAGSRSTCVVADERWLQRLLLRLAPHARVLAPAGVRRGVRRRGARTPSASTTLTRGVGWTAPSNQQMRSRCSTP